MVSIIIPSYNYARYLEDRINSILNQSYSDYEIIFIDDASTDGSLELAQKLLQKSKVQVRIIENEENSGSVFAQWQKGLELAYGEYIWFAEADDFCAPSFLEELMSVFEKNPNVGLVYSGSEVINDKNRVIYEDFYNRVNAFIDPLKWNTDYTAGGTDEVRNALFVKNTVPNASAVVMKTSLLHESGGIPQNFELSGDWQTYLNVLLKSDIGYIAKPLNYNRLHNLRVTAATDRTDVFFEEALTISEGLLSQLDIPEKSRILFLKNLFDYEKRSGRTLPEHIDTKIRSMFTDNQIIQARALVTQDRLLQRIARLTPKKVYRKVVKRTLYI